MSSQCDVIGAGSPIVDILAYVPESLINQIDGEKGGMELVDSQALVSIVDKLPEEQFYAPGGAAANTIHTLAKFGVSSSFLGMLGKDRDADFYQEEFKKAGCDTSRFKVHPDQPTARCLSLITPDAERTMRTNLGAASMLNPASISTSDFKGCRHLHIEGYLLFNRDLIQSLLEKANEAGCSISLDLGSFEVVRASMDILPGLLEKYVDIAFANEEEASAFIEGSTDKQQALEALAKLCKIAVVKLGKEGSLVKSGDKNYSIEAVPAKVVKDTTGAGDLWASGFLYGYVKGLSLDICARMGSIVGSEAVQHTGANLPLETCQKLKEEMNKLYEGE